MGMLVLIKCRCSRKGLLMSLMEAYSGVEVRIEGLKKEINSSMFKDEAYFVKVKECVRLERVLEEAYTISKSLQNLYQISGSPARELRESLAGYLTNI